MLNTQRLIKLRKSYKYTQAKIADMLNTSRPNYVRYERGNHQPPNEILSLMAEILKTSTDYLLGNTDDPSSPQKEKVLINDEDLKFALWGPAKDEITENELEDVRAYAQFVAERKKQQRGARDEKPD